MTTNRDAARSWLDIELGRIWLLAELCLRHLQQAGLRPHTSHATPDLDTVLSTRAAARGGSTDLDVLAGQLAELERDVETSRKTSPLGNLGRRLGLDRLELETLAFVIAPHIDPPLGELFNAIRGGARRGMNLALVTQLLRLRREDRVALLSTIDAERPLVALRLISVMSADVSDASATQRGIQPTHGLIELLDKSDELTSGVRAHATLLRAKPTFDDLVLPTALRTSLVRMSRTSGDLWTVLWGLAGAGKRTIASRLAAHAQRPLVAFDIMAVDKAARLEQLRLVQRDALAIGAALYVGPLDVSPETIEIVRRLERHDGMVVLGVETSRPPNLQIEHAARELEIAIPDDTARCTLWQRAVPMRDHDGGMIDDAKDLVAIAHNYHLTPGEILATGEEATAIAEAEDRAVTAADLRAGVERRLRNSLQDLAWRIDTKVKWTDLVLPREARGRVEEFIARRVFAHKVFGQWGFGDRVERGRGSIALFSGPPGTGKTMLAGLIAKGLGLELYQVDMSQIQSRWIGETEKALGRVFDLAERAHAVLLFDEADSLLSKRTDVETSNDRYANANVNYLLQRLEKYTGVVIMTTNKDTALDEALQRRLTLHLRLEVPDVAERERLWNSFLPAQAPRAADLDLAAVAREFKLTGGYIKNVVMRAAFLAALEDTCIGNDLLRRAAILELEDMGRVVTEGTGPRLVA